ncbi:MAG: hypothetical protein M3N12_00890 [Verrucomicrobiota bacterium]|nr:hypothetical protein [Verrucomicrobiota bacterium]
MEPSTEQEKRGDLSPAPRIGLRLMITIVIALALVAIYANIQKVRRHQIEQVIVTPVATATPSASTTPAP